MAQKKKPAPSGKKGGNGAGSTKVGSFAADGVASRKAARAEERRNNANRDALRETGEFFLKKNEGRSTDIFAIEAGHTGQYAIPGGNKASVHLRVQMYKPAVPAAVERPVVYFEDAQEGSGLPGNLSKDTFLPVKALNLDEYTPKFDGIQGETQGMLYKFITKMIDDKRAEEAKAAETQLIEDVFARSNKSLHGIKAEQVGQYGVKTSDGIAILQVFHAKAVSVSVLKSTIPGLVASETYIPLYLLNSKELKKVTDEVTFKRQVALHGFLKNIIDNLPEVEDLPKKATVFTKPETPKVKAEVNTDIKGIMRGGVGIALFATEDGKSAILKVEDKQTPRGLLRQFEVMEMSGFDGSTLLSFEVGSFVTAQQVIAGSLTKAELAGLSSKASSGKLALISFIAQAVKATRFCKKPSDALLPKTPELRQVA